MLEVYIIHAKMRQIGTLSVNKGSASYAFGEVPFEHELICYTD